jgi:hypothetical protein
VTLRPRSIGRRSLRADVRPSLRSRAGEPYRLGRTPRRWILWTRIYAWSAAAIAVAVAWLEPASATAVAGVAVAISVLDVVVYGRLPSEIHTDASGVHFTTRSQSTSMPWDDLLAIRMKNSRLPLLKWKFESGDVITWNGYERQRDLFDEVSRKAQRLRSLP